jgi:hypothetical protein
MATGLMYECETNILIQSDGGKRERRWVSRKVRLVDDGAEIRCMHCHGEVRIHRQRQKDGPQDHVEHRSGDDARHCRGGAAFRGTDQDHRMSPNPVP